ncbi:replication-associated protein [Giant house spider associated circular virus 4]|uniref:replication-associated protein n=1 Tax=Giant house spider associated circular virus 4 TaxID=2293291 RepID=UPI000E33776C|nr:replication-associated protein [Giant house spider associated circular virus 4]AXL65942.1 replication-associated protein [Giant house spider associated circular virus 4]
MSFRFNARAVFLTYPQCPLLKQHVLTMLRTKLGEDEGTHYLIGQETHKDGTPHLHIFVERGHLINTRNARYFDLEDASGIYHPNVTAPRDRADVIRYITKEDTEPVKWPETWKFDEPPKKRSKWEQATPLLLEGQDAATLLKSMPVFVLGNLKKVQEATAFLANIKQQASLPPLETFLTWVLPAEPEYERNIAFKTVWNELRDNLASKDFGRRQLYLHGPTGIGKSTFLRHLLMCIRTYILPNEDWYDHWDNNLFDLSVMEEFKGQKSIQWLNQWLDEAHFYVKRKGVAGLLKTNPIPTILISNFDINSSDVYPNMQESVSIQTLRRRLRSLPVDSTCMHLLTKALRQFLSSIGASLPHIQGDVPQTPPLNAAQEIVNPLWRGPEVTTVLPAPPVGGQTEHTCYGQNGAPFRDECGPSTCNAWH